MPDVVTSARSAPAQLHPAVHAAFLSVISALLIPNSMLSGAGDPDDSSVFAYIGWLMKRGYVPYRDVWDHKGPLLYYLNWLGWTLTPNSTLGIGILQVLAYAGAFYFLIRILQVAGVKNGPLFCAALFSVPALAQFSQGGDMAETWAILPIAASHLIAFRGLRARIVFWHFAVLGVCAAACFWIRPNLCVLPALALLGVGHLQRVRRGFVAGLGGLAIAGGAAALLTVFVLLPIHFACAWSAFRRAYFVYNADYSKFTSLKDHVVGVMKLLVVAKTMAFAYLAVAGWFLVRHSRLQLPPVYRILLFVGLPLEFGAAALSGRGYFHYLAPLWPTALILAGVAVHQIRSRFWFGRTKIVFASLLIGTLLWEGRRYALFEWKAVRSDPQAVAVASFIDAETGPRDRILGVGDVAAAAVAMRSRREPVGAFIYQLAMVHRANRDGAGQQHEELQAVVMLHPKIIFSVPGLAGDLCGNSESFRAEAIQRGYALDRMRELIGPLLVKEYRRAADPRFGEACVYERQ